MKSPTVAKSMITKPISAAIAAYSAIVLTTDQPQRVQQQTAQGLTLEQRCDLPGQLRVVRVGDRSRAHLRIRLTSGDRRKVASDEPVRVRLRLRSGVDLLARVLLQVRELGGRERGAALGRERDVLCVELTVHHVESEMGAEQTEASGWNGRQPIAVVRAERGASGSAAQIALPGSGATLPEAANWRSRIQHGYATTRRVGTTVHLQC